MMRKGVQVQGLTIFMWSDAAALVSDSCRFRSRHRTERKGLPASLCMKWFHSQSKLIAALCKPREQSAS